MKTYIDIRVGNYSGDIGDLAKRHSNDFTLYAGRRKDVHKYALTRTEGTEKYTTMISDSDLLLPYYNLLITVDGPRKEKVQRQMKEFVADIGIETYQPPQYFINILEESIKAAAEAASEKAVHRRNN